MPDDLDVRRLIEEVKAHPIIWDIRYGEYKDRTTTPQQWAEIAGVLGVDVEHCKRKWKNLRDAYRAEVRRIERRKERLKDAGNYDSSIDIRSKWAYFEPMSFINDSRRPRHHPPLLKDEGEGSNDSSHNAEEPQGFHSFCDVKLEPNHTTDEDDYEDDDRLFEEFVNAATPQAVRRLSNSISIANAVEDAAMPKTSRSSSSNNCKCSAATRADDQVHFLENLEREEESLMQSTRMDMRRDNTTNHVGDSDYNFLVSFLPQMKRMSDLQNLQFRAKMSELLLNMMTPPPAQPAIPMPMAMQMPPMYGGAATTAATTATGGMQLQSMQQQQLQQQPQQQLQLQPQQQLQLQHQPILRNAIENLPMIEKQTDELQQLQLMSQQDLERDEGSPQRQEVFTTSDFMDADQLVNSADFDA